MVYYDSVLGDQGAHSIFDTSLASPIPGFNGRIGRWAALISNRTPGVRRFERGEDEILGTLAASITPREKGR